MVYFSENAFKEYQYWQNQDKKTLKKINSLLKEISRNPKEIIGQSELLRGDLAGYAACRIDKKNRLVFKIENGTIFVIQCKGHYGDK